MKTQAGKISEKMSKTRHCNINANQRKKATHHKKQQGNLCWENLFGNQRKNMLKLNRPSRTQTGPLPDRKSQKKSNFIKYVHFYGREIQIL